MVKNWLKENWIGLISLLLWFAIVVIPKIDHLITQRIVGICILTFLVVTIGADVIIVPVMANFRKRFKINDPQKKDEDNGKLLLRTLGGTERIIYITAWLLSYPQFIALWITLKVAVTWKGYTGEEGQDYESHRKARARWNIFLLGNGFSILLAISIALLIQVVFK